VTGYPLIGAWAALTPFERRACRALAEHQVREAESVCPYRGRRSAAGDAVILDGVESELVFCKLFNVYPNLAGTGPSPADCYLPDGRSVDVKSTRVVGGRLLVTPWKGTLHPDLFALMVLEGDHWTYRGVCPAARVFTRDRLTNPGRGVCYAVRQDELFEVTEAETYADAV
jgi:hypothetical protein